VLIATLSSEIDASSGGRLIYADRCRNKSGRHSFGLVCVVCILDVAYWHEADQSARSDDVRSSGVERTLREWLATSEFDPKRTLGRSVCGRLLAFLPVSPSQSARF
jgi:hypothetical protein